MQRTKLWHKEGETESEEKTIRERELHTIYTYIKRKKARASDKDVSPKQRDSDERKGLAPLP